jgi:RNA-binding protein
MNMPHNEELIMTLTPKQKQQLKAKAHQLKPVVMLGNQGFSAAVQKEMDRALNDHELIKIRIAEKDRDARRELLAEICTTCEAELVQTIGQVGVLYRKNK